MNSNQISMATGRTGRWVHLLGSLLLCWAVACSTVQGCLVLQADWLTGLSYYQQGNYRRAVEELTAEIKTNPQYALGHRILGFSYFSLKEYDKAENSLKKSKELEPPTFQTELVLAQIRAQQQDFARALSVLESSQGLIRSDQDRFQYHYLRGSILFDTGDPSGAKQEFEEAERHGQDNYGVYARLGTLAYNQGDVEKSLEAFQTSLQLNPEQPQIWLALGEAYLQLARAGDTKTLEKALQASQEALKREPASWGGFNLAGRAYLGMREFAKAEQEFLQAAAIDETLPGFQYSLGQIYVGLKEYQKAVVHLEKASAETPDDASVHYALGFSHEQMGSYELALQSYSQAHQLQASAEYSSAVERVKKKLR